MVDLNMNQNQNTSYGMQQSQAYNMKQNSYDPNVQYQAQG